MFRTSALSRLAGGRRPVPFALEQRWSGSTSSTDAVTPPPPSSAGSGVISAFRTAETNPNNLSEKHLGRFYSISDEVFKKLYDHPRHHGFPLVFREQCQTFREQCVLVRKPYLDLKRCVDAVDLSKPVVRFVLYGTPGSGKTITLTSMCHYAHVNNYVLVNLTWLPLWNRYCVEVVHSTLRPGWYDHTIDAVTWLTKFKVQNTDLFLSLGLVTDKEYQWTKREITAAGSPLMEIVEHGIARPAHATEVMGVLFQELKAKSSKGQCKTMVLMDGVNDLFHSYCPHIYHPAHFRRVTHKVPHENVTAFLFMKDLLKADWSGGVIITTVDILAVQTEQRESHLPRYLLNKEGWETLDPFVPIEVPLYSSREIQTTIDYFLERKWLAHPKANTEEGRLELECLATGNAHTLAQLCSSR